LENTLVILVYATNAIVLLWAFLLGLKGKRIYSVLPGGLFLFHMASLAQFKLLITDFSFSTLLFGQSLMLVANILLLGTCVVFDNILLRDCVRFANMRNWLIPSRYSKRHYLIIMFVVIFVIIALQLRSGIGRISIGWEEARESTNMVDSWAILLSFIVFPCLWVAFRSKFYMLALLLGLLCFSIFQIIGSRAILLTFFAAAYSELLLTDFRLRKKITIMALLALLAFGLHTLSRLTRGLGLVGIIGVIMSGQLTNIANAIGAIDFSGGESNVYLYYNYVIEKSYDHYPYHAWITAKRLLFLYLPTGWFPDIKPPDITYTFYIDAFSDGIFDASTYYNKLAALIDAGQTGSIHPDLWGDAYANGGIAGILIYPICLGFILVLIERWLRKLSPVGVFMIVPLTIVGYLMIARGNIVIGFGYLGYIIPMALVLAYITRLPFLTKNKRRSKLHDSYTVSG
jgi:hypothetical protein